MIKLAIGNIYCLSCRLQKSLIDFFFVTPKINYILFMGSLAGHTLEQCLSTNQTHNAQIL